MSYYGKVTDKSGNPLENIKISDGRNIVYTDKNGEYSITGFERTHLIYVCALTELVSDWFRYVEEDGRYDFVIEPVNTSNNVCFFHLSDTEIENRADTSWVDFVRDKAEKHQPHFIMHTGDLCRKDGVLKHIEVFNEKTAGRPVRYAIGNHDFIGERYGEEIYERLYGPCWYSFDMGDTHFIVTSIGKGDNPSGYESTDQWLWLENDLKTNKKSVVMFNHNLCSSDETGFVITEGDFSLDLKKHRLKAWFFGHYHYHFMHRHNGIFSVCSARPDSGGIDSSAGGVRKVILKDGNVFSEMLYNAPECKKSEGFIWQTQLQGRVEFSTPQTDGKSIYIGTMDDGHPKKCGVYCLDIKTGEINWYFKTENGIKNDVAFDDGNVYAQDSTGILYCLNANNGSLVWSAHSPLLKAAYTRANVLIVNNLVIAGAGRHTYAYDKRTGEPVWNCDIGRSDASPSRFVYNRYKNCIIANAQWKAMSAIDANSGKLIWSNGTQPLWFRTSSPLVTKDAIYTCGNTSIIKVDVNSGEIIKTADVGFKLDSASAPVLENGILYVPTGKKGVIAVDKDSFKIMKFYKTEPSRLYTPPYEYGDMQTVEGSPIIDNENIIFSASDGNVWVYKKDSGKLISKYKIGAPSLVTPIVTDDCIITADFEGRITKFKK